MEDWENGKKGVNQRHKWKIGKMEKWKYNNLGGNGEMEEWKMERWRNGKVELWFLKTNWKFGMEFRFA